MAEQATAESVVSGNTEEPQVSQSSIPSQEEQRTIIQVKASNFFVFTPFLKFPFSLFFIISFDLEQSFFF